MAKKPTPRSEFVLFDVIYEDGSQRSNRKVPAELLGGLDGDDPARTEIAAQDLAIAEKSRVPPLKIKSLKRSGGRWSGRRSAPTGLGRDMGVPVRRHAAEKRAAPDHHNGSDQDQLRVPHCRPT